MDATDRPTVISLMGPTASGKTAAAIALAEALPVEIVSVDSSQVYRGMDIGTAKPTREELARAPHRLIDIRDPAQPYSAAEFCQDAHREITEILGQGRIPLLVGGTMFYFHALEYGLSALPGADSEVREHLCKEAAAHGWPALHARLAVIDPEAAARIAMQDAQRIQRALEIHALTGQAPSALGRERPLQTPAYRFVKLALMPQDRAALHARIAERFERMLAQGLIEEVRRLFERGDLSVDLPSIRTVGYRQTWEYLRGEINYNELIEKATAATRQLAKRQFTWMRRHEGLHCWDIWQPRFRDEMVASLRRQRAIQG